MSTISEISSACFESRESDVIRRQVFATRSGTLFRTGDLKEERVYVLYQDEMPEASYLANRRRHFWDVELLPPAIQPAILDAA